MSVVSQQLAFFETSQLAELMMDFGVGVTTAATYVVTKLDLDYFGEE
jgi:restriction endonuclease Mrr